MKTTRAQPSTVSRLLEDARIIWALFTKDALETLKNKNTIVVIFTSLFMVLFYSTLPALSSQDELPAVLIYDASGSSSLVQLLETRRSIQVYTYPSEESMKRYLADGMAPELGLVIPENFDRALHTGATPELQGYVLRWVKPDDADTLQRIVETEVASLLGRPINIQMAGSRVDLQPDSRGLGETASFGLSFVIIMTGVILIPHLMLDEKQNRTLDVLTVSPASPAHIAAGKALAGLLYCVLGGMVALAANQVLVVHWGLAILTLLVGSLFTVSCGLWLGMKIESRAELSMWSWVILLPLIMPVVFSLLSGLVPDALVRVAKMVPTSAVFDLTRISFANPVPVGKTLLLFAWVAAAAGLVLALVAWGLHRRDRQSEAFFWKRDSSGGSLVGSSSLTPLQDAGSLTRQVRRAPLPQPGPVVQHRQVPPGLLGTLAMIRIIAVKDLLEALKNRLILSILLGSTFILISAAALPMLLSSKDQPALVVYDEGRSQLLRDLAAQENWQVAIVDSPENMKAGVNDYSSLAMGLILPGDFDERASRGQPLELVPYYSYWASPNELSRLNEYVEDKFQQADWKNVQLDRAGQVVFPSLNTGGLPLMLIFNLIAVVLVIGVALVPLLLVEEKEAHTLNVLLISPASLLQVIIGKALAGLFYSLLPVSIVMVYYRELFIHWDVAVLSVVLAAVLAVIVGLLIGILADSPTSASLWGSFLLLLLIGSAVIKMYTSLDLPAAVQSALEWLPGAAMLQLFSISLVGEFPTHLLWMNIGALLAAILVISLILAWRLRWLEQS